MVIRRKTEKRLAEYTYWFQVLNWEDLKKIHRFNILFMM